MEVDSEQTEQTTQSTTQVDSEQTTRSTKPPTQEVNFLFEDGGECTVDLALTKYMHYFKDMLEIFQDHGLHGESMAVDEKLVEIDLTDKTEQVPIGDFLKVVDWCKLFDANSDKDPDKENKWEKTFFASMDTMAQLRCVSVSNFLDVKPLFDNISDYMAEKISAWDEEELKNQFPETKWAEVTPEDDKKAQEEFNKMYPDLAVTEVTPVAQKTEEKEETVEG